MSEVQVGKYTLESLTTGMYSDPMIIYREYIQNSVDSLENAVFEGIIEPQVMRIDIIIDDFNSTISIKDNGTGISSSKAKETLMDVGNSKKRQSTNRGFRGIGRLGGMSYCDRLVFTTSFESEDVKTIISFDCKKLKHLLVPGQHDHMSLSDVLSEITSISTEPEKKEKHYFITDMFGVDNYSEIMSLDSAKNYISQVAPLAYQSRKFIYAPQVHSYTMESGYKIEEFPIFIGPSTDDLEPVYKPNCSHFKSDRSKKIDDDISSVEFFKIEIDDELYAIGWYGDCGWYGTLSDHKISGIRVRKGNILIGDGKTLNDIFPESRFNGWTQGELFVLTDKLIPNARRDDFEKNEYYIPFIDSLKLQVGQVIAKKIREASTSRNDNTQKAFKQVKKKLDETDNSLREGFNSSVDKEKLIESLTETLSSLDSLKVKQEQQEKKKELVVHVQEKIAEVKESNKYKINKINSGIDKKSKQVLKVVSNILSRKLSKLLVDDIIEEIITELNRK